MDGLPPAENLGSPRPPLFSSFLLISSLSFSFLLCAVTLMCGDALRGPGEAAWCYIIFLTQAE